MSAEVRYPAHFADAYPGLVGASEEREGFTGDPFGAIAGDNAIGPGGGVVPFHAVRAEESAAVLLFEEDSIGEELPAGFYEALSFEESNIGEGSLAESAGWRVKTWPRV